MATRDLTPQDEENKDYVPDEDGAGVEGQSGDPDVDNPANPTQVRGNDVPDGEAAEDEDGEERSRR